MKAYKPTEMLEIAFNRYLDEIEELAKKALGFKNPSISLTFDDEGDLIYDDFYHNREIPFIIEEWQNNKRPKMKIIAVSKDFDLIGYRMKPEGPLIQSKCLPMEFNKKRRHKITAGEFYEKLSSEEKNRLEREEEERERREQEDNPYYQRLMNVSGSHAGFCGTVMDGPAYDNNNEDDDFLDRYMTAVQQAYEDGENPDDVYMPWG